MKFILAFLQALPAIVQLIKTLQQQASKEAVKQKVSEKIKGIDEAFRENNPEKLNSLFRSQ